MQPATSTPAIFSSPANGSDDLFGPVTNKKIIVYSRYNGGKCVWEKKISKHEQVFLLSDPTYTNESANHFIAVVITNSKMGSNIVICGSTIESFSYNKYDTGDIEGWRAEVCNSNVSYVFAKVDGEEWFSFEHGGENVSQEEHKLHTITINGGLGKVINKSLFFNHKFEYNSLEF